VAALPDPNVALIEGDLREITREAIRAAAGLPDDGAFDVILSDMAPYTSGEHLRDHHRSVRLCEAVLDRVPDLLKPGGHVVMKVFEGTAYPDLLARLRRMFRTVKGFKPKASRDTSTEIYVIAHGFRGRDTTAPTEDAAPERALPPRKPSTGWS
ncbi:MAG: hypothetical protein KDA25_10285, partial [Phycisphaerales bacterium]|nr:hypothetical protein [Phycisphaerales bacterium]